MAQHSKMIDELTVYDGAQATLFCDTSARYVIPLYQRAYAWTDVEIEQLIDDIMEHSGKRYYVGSLIVYRRGGEFEVIDGQQRLTTLLLLLLELGLPVRETLSFACRKRADDTLRKYIQGREIPDEDLEQNLARGRRIIAEKLAADKIDWKTMAEKLTHLRLYRIQVPPGTDLNRYFEIMNTRGEQLEQHDILKATLMSEIRDSDRRELFADIWEACSDMTGYVQMHFGTTTRDTLFGASWDWLPELEEDAFAGEEAEAGPTIDEILAPGFLVSYEDGETDKGRRVRFESIIDFPYFLLHVLRVYVSAYGVKLPEGQRLPRRLDDKRLLREFDHVARWGKWGNVPISGDKEEFSLSFLQCLLKCRFLFDQYIIKREYASESADGAWSLKQLAVSRRKRQRRAYYKNTAFQDYREWSATSEARNQDILMLQSALRVSYTSPKVMHWITQLMIWLYDDDNRQAWWSYPEEIEEIAIQAVRRDFFMDGGRDMGINTPHIVFNYLDYLLWRENKGKYADFVFEFRNSVEHWHPQHPSEGTFEGWKREELDDFGNLCIVQRGVNSRFSNLAPAAKKSTFEQMIGKGSLKLRLMARLTGTNRRWKDVYREHGDRMLEKLRLACRIE